MKKTIIIVIAVMLVVLVGIVVGRSINEASNFIQTDSKKVENNTNKVSNQKVENKTENEENNIINNDVTNTIENIEQEEIVIKTDLDKAIDLVKKDWGEDNTVYFAQDGKTEKGEFIICVRDNETTGARAWYSVNVEAGTVEKWE